VTFWTAGEASHAVGRRKFVYLTLSGRNVQDLLAVGSNIWIARMTWTKPMTFWTAGLFPQERAPERSSSVYDVLRVPDGDDHHQLPVPRQLCRQLRAVLRGQRTVPSHCPRRCLLCVHSARPTQRNGVPRTLQ